MTDLSNLTTFSTEYDSFYNAKRLVMNDLPSLSSFSTGYYSFYEVIDLSMNNVLLASFSTGYRSFYSLQNWSMTNIFNFTTFSVGAGSFNNLPAFTLDGIV